MTIVEMLEQSGVLTLLGMGVVFGFLVILIVCISLVGRLIHAMGLDRGSPASAGLPPAGSAKKAGDGAVTAAITAAVDQYRKTNS